MAASIPEAPAGTRETLGSNLTGIGSFLMDPEAAGRRLHAKWFWVGPVIVISLISIASQMVLLPVMQHVLEIQPLPANVNPEQFQRRIAVGMAIQHVVSYLMPVVVAVLLAIQALILFGSASVLAIETRFRSLFNLAAGCGVISALAALAMAVIVKAKGDASTLADLRPPLGLDLFLGDGANRYLNAFLGFFSIFEIWWIVMAVLVFSAGFRVSKGKAAAVVAPLVLLSLLFRLVSAAFQR